MRVAMLTREWPPHVYGGAGVHVVHLAERLRELVDLRVHCFGDTRQGATGHLADPLLSGENMALAVLSTNLRMAAAAGGVDLVHSHTWYTNLAGLLTGRMYGVPHVMTTHSLEPRRAWKRDQLGGGYDLSVWTERTAVEQADAVIAVSRAMRDDVLACYPAVDPGRIHVVHNGIDTTVYRPDGDDSLVRAAGVDPGRPYVIFVGRITRQKGLPLLLAAARRLTPGVQLVVCAGAADTPELAAAVRAEIEALQAERGGVFWLAEMLPVRTVVQLLSHAVVFVCPSVYEPLGIVNLEAMACGTAVVASDVGGIPEVVIDGENGLLVHYDADDEEGFVAGLARAINRLVTDPTAAAAMGKAGRERAEREFGWQTAAGRTVDVYRRVQ
jgi:starch synthase